MIQGIVRMVDGKPESVVLQFQLEGDQGLLSILCNLKQEVEATPADRWLGTPAIETTRFGLRQIINFRPENGEDVQDDLTDGQEHLVKAIAAKLGTLPRKLPPWGLHG